MSEILDGDRVRKKDRMLLIIYSIIFSLSITILWFIKAPAQTIASISLGVMSMIIGQYWLTKDGKSNYALSMVILGCMVTMAGWYLM